MRTYKTEGNLVVNSMLPDHFLAMEPASSSLLGARSDSRKPAGLRPPDPNIPQPVGSEVRRISYQGRLLPIPQKYVK